MDLHSKLEAVLQTHFKEASTEAIEHQANKIYGAYSTSTVLQKMERTNAAPQQDIESIEKAIGNLKRAQNSLQQVGWHGGNTLVPMAQKLKGEGNPEQWKALVGNTESANVVADKIGKMISGLEEAKEQISPDAAPIFEYLGEEVGRGGRPFGTAVYYTSRKCAEIYHALSGVMPTVNKSDYEGNIAKGPFIEFLTDVFNALDLSASIEAAATIATREYREILGV